MVDGLGHERCRAQQGAVPSDLDLAVGDGFLGPKAQQAVLSVMLRRGRAEVKYVRRISLNQCRQLHGREHGILPPSREEVPLRLPCEEVAIFELLQDMKRRLMKRTDQRGAVLAVVGKIEQADTRGPLLVSEVGRRVKLLVGGAQIRLGSAAAERFSV